MKFALQTLPDGMTQMVDASGNTLGRRDADRPILHVLPKLLVPAGMLWYPGKRTDRGLRCEDITLSVSSSLPIDLIPEGGIVVSQPYPNRRYFVGGSHSIRNGWIVPISPELQEFDIEFQWHVESSALWPFYQKDDWLIRHQIHVKLRPGEGTTYSMDVSNWPRSRGSVVHQSPISVFGFEQADEIDREKRQIVRDTDLVYTNGDLNGELAGYYLEEVVDIPGALLEQAWSIDAFQEEQLHEIAQTTSFSQDNEAHRDNGLVEMPAELLVKAIELASEVSFEEDSDFAASVAGTPGGMEQHPAMKLLCDWWQQMRPQGQPLEPGWASVLVRVRDDGEYWWADREIPNAPVIEFNPGGLNAARIGDQILVFFMAKQESAVFDAQGMTTFLPNGEPFSTLGIDREKYISEGWDEARNGLRAMANFSSNFPYAWDNLRVLRTKEV